ncbi:MAG: NAD(P)-binding protein [Pseudonocardiaceae bacterium]|nr:NAD(P)-binding protein [Pseudonocardiaceae bacterium]
MADRQHAVVVGGGIGGLGAALGLRRAGWRVTVLERADRFDPVGAGITLMPNALRALDALGMGSEVRALVPVQQSGGLRTSSGRWLSRWDGAAVEQLMGAPMVALHRADLHRILRAPLPAESVRTGVEVLGVGQAPDGRPRVQCAAAAAIDEPDLVVAADGIDSRVRTQRWPEVPGPAYTGLTTWRGMSPEPSGPPLDIGRSWGRGAEFGIIPLTDGRIYWFGAVEAQPGVRHDDERAAVRERFGHWHAPIRELVDTSEVVLHHDIHHLRTLPRSFVRGRVVLLGDAAHAMPPQLGQGGCQALEDAVVLAASLVRERDIDAALARYDEQRRPRTGAVARSAGQVGRLNVLANPLAVAARNMLIRLTPSAVGIRGLARFGRWEPPDIPGPSVPERAAGSPFR